MPQLGTIGTNNVRSVGMFEKVGPKPFPPVDMFGSCQTEGKGVLQSSKLPYGYYTQILNGRATITGKSTGYYTVWGNNQTGYTTDSDFSAAAVHAGILTNGQTGTVLFQSIGVVSYTAGSTANGVTTINWGSNWCCVTLSKIIWTITPSVTSVTAGGTITYTITTNDSLAFNTRVPVTLKNLQGYPTQQIIQLLDASGVGQFTFTTNPDSNPGDVYYANLDVIGGTGSIQTNIIPFNYTITAAQAVTLPLVYLGDITTIAVRSNDTRMPMYVKLNAAASFIQSGDIQLLTLGPDPTAYNPITLGNGSLGFPLQINSNAQLGDYYTFDLYDTNKVLQASTITVYITSQSNKLTAVCTAQTITAGGLFSAAQGKSYQFLTGIKTIQSTSGTTRNIPYTNYMNWPTTTWGSGGLGGLFNSYMDDSWVQVNLPFSITFLGVNYSTIYVGSNLYITFNSGYGGFSGLAYNNPPDYKICIASQDSQLTNLYGGLVQTSNGPAYRLRWEGNTDYTNRSINFVYEIEFYQDHPEQFKLNIVQSPYTS